MKKGDVPESMLLIIGILVLVIVVAIALGYFHLEFITSGLDFLAKGTGTWFTNLGKAVPSINP